MPSAAALHTMRRTADQRVAAVAGVVCSDGCSSCCYQLIPVLKEEARSIVAHVTRKGGTDAVDDLLAKCLASQDEWSVAIARVSARGIAITDATMWSHCGVRCPMLDSDERCSIYDIRPIACRAFISKGSRAACDLKRNGFAGPIGTRLVYAPPANAGKRESIDDAIVKAIRRTRRG